VIRVRTYGVSGPPVVVLHGGPAAAGNAEPIARGLADTFRVVEPWQRGSGETPLSVAQHVLDLHQVIQVYCPNAQPALVGESWGAMLALAYAADHPEAVGPIVLIGCGTFDPASRRRLDETIDARIDDELRARLKRLPEEFPDPMVRLQKRYELTESLYGFDPIPPGERNVDMPPLDLLAHAETWADMMRLQEGQVYPAAFTRIESPVLMLHGTYDPHPGGMIRASLERVLPQLEYREWERCGHSPWLERGIREQFFAVVRNWLLHHFAGQPAADATRPTP